MNSRVPTILLAALLLLPGCKKEKDDPGITSGGYSGNGNSGTATLNLNTPRGVMMTIDSTTYNFIEGSPYGALTNIYGTQVAPPAQSTARIYYGISSFGARFGSFNYVGNDLSSSQLFSFFTAGTVEYGYPITDMDRVSLVWSNSGAVWSTSEGSMDQTGSNFTIEEVLPVTPAGINYILLRVSFNCTLYHPSTGEAKSVTNGSGVFMIQNI